MEVNRTLVDAVLAQARRTPEAPAVAEGDRVLSYGGLERLSGAVACGLRAKGIRPGQAVAVCLPRSWELICVMLGIRRAGATVVALDAQSPQQRRQHIIEDSASVAVVVAGPDAPQPPAGVQALRAAELLATAAGPFDEITHDNATSFVFYTSGTTGRPKGVEVGDAGILRMALPGWICLDAGKRFASLSNPAFDALTFEVWVPLLTGGTCVVLGDDQLQTPRRLVDAVRQAGIDTMFVTTALFNTVVDAVPNAFSSVGQVLVGGEQLNGARIQRWYRDNAAGGARLINVYGPTESTTFALYHPIPVDFDGDIVPIGRPLPLTGALLVADGCRLARDGELAELYLSGTGLAARYRNLPEETTDRFVRLPWHDDGARRWYRTGDLVRRDAAGLISYAGRADRQVKVRGFRIEPAEVERQLAAHPAVQQVRVCTRRNPDNRHELLAYLVLGDELAFEAYHQHIAATLPPYMRPHHTHLVDSLPRTPNGKIDEKALLKCGVAPWRRRRVAT